MIGAKGDSPGSGRFFCIQMGFLNMLNVSMDPYAPFFRSVKSSFPDFSGWLRAKNLGTMPMVGYDRALWSFQSSQAGLKDSGFQGFALNQG